MEKSVKESSRFGINVHRGLLQSVDYKKINTYILNEQLDILVIRLDTSIKANHAKLLKIGFPTLHADTLVYYKCELNKVEVNKLKNNITFIQIDCDNDEYLNVLIPRIFDQYQNHYTSNEKLNKSNIIQGYIEWALDYASNEDNGKISWYCLNSKQEIIGFATCYFDSTKKFCEGVLYGLLPEFSGGGVYGDLIRYTQKYFKDKGFETMNVSTQIQNFAVQKVWSREGFYMFRALDTYHVNAFLSEDNISFKTKLVVNDPDIISFGEFTGDFNPIHFSDSAAKEAGFESRIAHGMKFELFLTKILGTEWPGKGTIIIENKVLFKHPIYPNKVYTLRIKTIHEPKENMKELVAVLTTKENRIVNIAYITVIQNDPL